MLIAADNSTNTYVEYAPSGSDLTPPATTTSVGTFTKQDTTALSGTALHHRSGGALSAGGECSGSSTARASVRPSGSRTPRPATTATSRWRSAPGPPLRLLRGPPRRLRPDHRAHDGRRPLVRPVPVRDRDRRGVARPGARADRCGARLRVRRRPRPRPAHPQPPVDFPPRARCHAREVGALDGRPQGRSIPRSRCRTSAGLLTLESCARASGTR